MIKKILKSAVAVLLVIASLNTVAGGALAEERLNNMYVSEISVGTKEELKAAGYIVSDQNLNEGGTDTYIGYKLTDDEDDAITDVSALGMYGHYSTMTYQKMLMNDNEHIAEMGAMLRTAATAFARKYNAGNPFAEVAYKILNARSITDDTGKEVPLGDYLVSSRSLDDFKKLGLISSNAGTAYILNQLAFGITEDTAAGDSTWLQRLCANGPLEFTDDETGAPLDEGTIEDIYASQYDAEYMQRARRLFAAVSAFADSYDEAAARSGSIETAVVSDEEAAEAAENAADSISEGTTLEFGTDDADVSGEEVGDLLPLAQYALLDSKDGDGNAVYPFGTKDDGSVRTLAEFFIEVGNMEDGTDAYRELYPLMVSQNGTAPLTEAQEVLMYLAGFSTMVTTGASDRESLAEADAKADENIAELLSLNNGQRLSIWYDVNTEIYDECQEGVFWTSELAREAAAGNRYNLLTKPAGAKDLTLNQKLKNAAIITGCIGIAALGAAIIAVKILTKLAIVKGLVGLINTMITYATTSAVAYSTGAMVGLCLGTVFVVVVVLVIVALLIIGLIWLFKNVILKEDEELEMTEMPKVMYDYNDAGEGSAVIYRAVNSVSSGTPANLNAGVKNTPWVALYYSKDPALGEPLTAEMDGDTVVTEPVVIKQSSQTAPDKYCPLCFFEAVVAANLNEYRSGTKGVFVFFHRRGGVVPAVEGQGKYLASLKLFSATGNNREETAKNQAIVEKFTLIDFNLTSDSSMASYVGYKSTDDETQALTDIRVSYGSGLDPDDATVSYGGAEYGCYGNAGGLLLMATKFACAGSPILVSDIIVTDTLGDAPAGYEPVNLFCGGPAYDFNNCNKYELKDDYADFKEKPEGWKNHAYIYFHPSETYTSGTEYIGGLAFFSGDAADYMNEMGWTPLTNASLNGGSDEGITYDLGGVQDGTTTLCYTTTYNPKRAICDIQYFGAEPSTQGVASNLRLSSGGGVTCEVFQQGGGSVGNYRTIRLSHCYRSSLEYEGGGRYEYTDCLDEGEIRGYVKKTTPYTEWYSVNGKEVVSNICCAALYVVGPGASGTPIKKSELVVGASSEYSDSTEYSASSITPVRSIVDNYSETGANLAFNDLYRSGNMYLYIKRADPYAVIPDYIASVTVAYAVGKGLDKDDGVVNPHDVAVMSLMGNGAGRLIEVDLSGTADPMERVKDFRHEYTEGSGEYATTRYQHVDVLSHDANYASALVWVTYTKSRTSAISDIAIYESADGTVPDIVTTSDGSATKSCGAGFKLGNKGTTYYLRAIYNMGNPITDVIIDTDVMTDGYWTSITTEGKVSSYEQYYIKAKHFRKANLTYYISGICSSTGKTEKEALYGLLSQGCRYYCPYNLSPDGKGQPLYVGYNVSTGYKNGFSGIILHDGGQDSKIDTIVKGRDTYVAVTDSLNSGVYDSLIRMYVTKSARKACESGGTSASTGHYITGITFFNAQDLNEYALDNTLLDELDPETREYVEKLIVDDDGEPMYWDIVTNSKGQVINCNVTALKGGYIDTSAPEVYMYIHYSDNETPAYDNMTGSVFTNNPMMSVVVCTGGALIALAAAYVIIKKRKAVQETASVPAE